MIAALLAIVLVLAIGESLLALVRREVRWPIALRLSVAFVVGQVVLGAVLLAASLAGYAVRETVGAIVAATIAGTIGRFAGAARPPGRWVRRAPGPEWQPVERALVVALIVLLAIPLVIAATAPIAEWDVVAIWGLKARALVDQPIGVAELFQDPSRAYSHLDYPLLWPLVLAWVWSFTGPEDLVAVGLSGGAVLLALVGLLYGTLRVATPRRTALFAVVALVATPLVSIKSIRLLADPVVALFELALVAGCLLYFEREDRGALVLAGFAGAGLWTTKNEGLGLLAIVACCFGAAALRRGLSGRGRELALAVAPFAAVVPWLVVSADLPRLHHNQGWELVRGLGGGLERLGDVARTLPPALFDLSDWALFWPLAAVAAFAAAARGRPSTALVAAAFAVALPWPLVVLGLAGHELPVPVIVDLAASRLALQLAPATAFVIAWALAAEPERGRAPVARPPA